MLILRDTASAEQLLVETAEREDLVSAVVRDEEDETVWRIEFESGGVCEVQWLQDPARLALAGNFGRPDSDRLAHFQAQALAFNLLGADTGGCRIGADPESAEFFLVQDVAADDLARMPLGERLVRFEALRAFWEYLLRTHAAPADLREAVQGLMV